MYQAPQLTKFGTFRDITLTGKYGPIDGATIKGDGCTFNSNGRCS
jgi:hypothetical protein